GGGRNECSIINPIQGAGIRYSCRALLTLPARSQIASDAGSSGRVQQPTPILTMSPPSMLRCRLLSGILLNATFPGLMSVQTTPPPTETVADDGSTYQLSPFEVNTDRDVGF